MKGIALLLFALLLPNRSLALPDGDSTEAETLCEDNDVDDRVYMFGYGTDFLPYQDVNEDGEVFGFYYDIVRAICQVMNKKCEHVVFYDYNLFWDNKQKSLLLNNGWCDVCVGYLQTQPRRSAYGFVATFALEASAYLYVRKGGSIDTLDDIRNNANAIGFRRGWWLNPPCIERYLGVSLAGKAKDQYNSYEELANALDSGEVDAMLAAADNVKDDSRFTRVNNDPIRCARGGHSMMIRKDKVHQFTWMDEGLKKLRQNGDYGWLCNIAEKGGDPRCFD